MSVPEGDRGKSSMQFIETANTIEKRAMEVCRKWPKGYMFIITQRTIELASEIYEHAQKANAIMVQTEVEKQERVLELLRALGANYAFAGKIERAYSMFPLCGMKEKRPKESEQTAGHMSKQEEEKSGKILQEFMELCAKEEESLKGNLTYTRNIKIEEKARDEPEKKTR